jgi:hypothetical protein
MSLPEIDSQAACVPVSKAETPVAARVLPLSNSETTGSVSPGFVEGWADVTFGAEPGTARQRAERRLWELEALVEFFEAEIGNQTPRGRLLRCRWVAARALFLEVLERYEPSPPDRRPMGSPWEAMEETGLIGALCRTHGWRCCRPGVLVRREAPRRG